MAEIDRKIDDGNPVGGTFQFSTYDWQTNNPTAATCVDTSSWKISGGETNCGGASLF